MAWFAKCQKILHTNIGPISLSSKPMSPPSEEAAVPVDHCCRVQALTANPQQDRTISSKGIFPQAYIDDACMTAEAQTEKQTRTEQLHLMECIWSSSLGTCRCL